MLSQGGPRYVLGDWALCAATARLERGSEVHTLEPRHAQVLAVLCERAGEVLSAEDLLAACWGGEPSGDNPVHKAVSMLRRALGDSATAPRYIETLRKRGYRLLVPVRRVGGAQALAHQGGWTLGSPFRGLQAFGPEHAAVFYGREQATQSLLRAALAQLQPAASGLCVVLGPSGSGKSSLVQAGLIPALLSRPAAPLTAGGPSLKLGSVASLHLGEWAGEPSAAQGQAPAGELLQTLALAFLDWELNGRAVFEGHSAHSLAANLLHSLPATLSEFSVRLKGQKTLEAPPAREVLVLFIDQLEALFTRASGAEASGFAPGSAAQHFAEVLQALLATGQVLVVAACRNDFYPQLMAHSAFMQAKASGGHFDLMPPSRAEMAQMVRLPARAAGLSFGLCPQTLVSLDELLVEDAAYSPDALPLLQFTLQQLWQQRSPDGELSVATYRALGGGQGGLEGMIAEQAERVLRQLTPVQQAGLPHVLSLLVVVGEDDAEAAPVRSRRARWRDLQGPTERELVQALVEARLLVSDGGVAPAAAQPSPAAEPLSVPSATADRGFRVAHEALLRRWPRVTAWIAQHRQDLHTRARLRQQAQRWRHGGRAAEFLLPRGRQLQAAQALQHSPLWRLSPDEQAYVQASGRRVRWAARLRGAALSGLVLLTLLAAVMAWQAQQAQQLAQSKRASSERLLGYMLGEVTEQLRPEGRLALLEGVGQQALAVLGDEADIPRLSDEERLQRAKALLLLGEVQFNKKQLAPAAQAFAAAAALVRPAAATATATATPPATAAHRFSPERFKTWGAAEYWQGLLARENNDLAANERHYQAYRQACLQWLAAWPQSDEARLELAMADVNLGVLALRRLQLPGAAAQLEQAANRYRALLARQPRHLPYLKDLVSSLTWATEVAVRQDRPSEALALADEALALLARWQALAPPDMEVPRSLAALHDWRRWAHLAQGQRQEAEQALVVALALRSRLAAHDRANTNWQLRQLMAELDLALLRPPPTSPAELAAQARQLAAARQRLQAWQAQGPLPQASGLARMLAWLQARLAAQQGQAPQALAALAQAPARPASALNTGWAELNNQAGLDALQLQLLQGQPAAWRPACAAIHAFWAPLQPRPQQGPIGTVWALAQACAPTGASPAPGHAGSAGPAPLNPRPPGN